MRDMSNDYQANPEHFAMQMDVFARMRKIEEEFRAAARSAVKPEMPVNATREHAAPRAPALPRSDAARAFAPGGHSRQLPYPRGEIDLRRLTKAP
jgi:DNA-nicking Smr family endonuclease